MIRAKELLNRMVTHLSDWLVIRRNPLDSAGGKILLGVAEEVVDIGNAIEEYVQSHFINSYLNETHAIDYEYMRFHVGAVDVSNIKITSHYFDVINDMNLFAESSFSCRCSLLHENYLYFKTYHVSEGDEIEYKIYDKTFIGVAEHISIWNIYDEFALYVGITRFEREDNEHLLGRILFQSQNPVNSSSTGIQNAIANITGLQPKDVVIEKIDENNYLQNDFTGKTLFEQLIEINRDVYRSKRWGVDYWQHDMDYVTYLPHEYDVKPGFYQNGIGDNDDLKVGMTRKNEIVHLEVKGYAKDENTIEEYYKKYPIEVTTNLKLFKPENTINPLEVNALIEAGTLTEVTDSPMLLTYRALRSASELVRLNDIVATDTLAAIKSTYNFIAGRSYDIKIKSKAPYGSFNAQVTHNQKSLLSDQDDFSLNEFDWLTHSRIKLYANQLSYFSEYGNFSHEPEGFRLKPQFTSGQLRLSLKGFQNQNVHYQIKPSDFDRLSDNAISYKNFSKMPLENAYQSKLNNDAIFAIRQTANQIKFYVEGSAVILIKSATGDYELKIENSYFQTSDEPLTPVDFLIHVIPSASDKPIKIKELQFTHYEVKSSLEKSEILNGLLPNEENNQLTIEVKTYTNASPTIGFIYIGQPLDDLSYTVDTFTYKKGDIVDFKGTGVLFEITDKTTLLTTVCEQNVRQFKSLIEQELKIDLSGYKTIYRLEAYDGGHILNKKGEYYLKLEKDEICTYLAVQGEIVDFTKQFSLGDVVRKKAKAKYYISPIVEGFIEELDYDMAVVTPRLDYRYGEYTISNCAPLIPVFKTANHTSHLNSSLTPVELFYLKAPVEKRYKAYNKQFLYEGSIKDIAVNKNFDPILPYNEKLFYKVTPLTENTNVYFYNKDKEALQGEGYESPYSVDIKTLNYYADFSLSECLKRSYQEIVLKIKLNKRILLPNYVLTPIGESLDLREYLITPESGMNIYYTSPQDEDLILDPTYMQTEKFTLESDGFKKLKFCHLHNIIYCSFKPFIENATSDIGDTYFSVIKELGVIQFNDYFTKQNLGRTIYIHYLIQKPTMLILDTDKLYNIASVTHEAYKSLFVKYINGIVGDVVYNDELFRISDYVTVSVSEPGYLATASQKEKLIRVIEVGARDRIAVHKGFYYLDGEEYYLFGANNDGYEEYKNDHVEAYNATYMEDGMIFQGHSENLIRNSVFNCSTKARLFSTDFSELKSVNYFKRLNACEQINLWDHRNMRLEIQDGLYGAGINFGPIESSATHFIGLPIEQTGDNLTISFWLKGDAVPVVFQQECWAEEMPLTLTRPQKKIHFSNKGLIYYAELPYVANAFYYLFIKGSGTIDDLILCQSSVYNTTLHDKNLKRINMPQFDAVKSPYQRVVFKHQQGYTGTTQMLETGEIVPTAAIQYSYTPLLDKDWMTYATAHEAVYKDNCFIPITSEAYVLSPVIQLKNKNFIKEIIIRPNFLSEEVAPFTVYMGSTEKTLRPVKDIISNAVKLEEVQSYLQVKCNLKNALYSLDISVRYIEGAIPDTYEENYFESELFDLGSISSYELESLSFDIYNNAKVYVRTGRNSALLEDYKPLTLSDKGNLFNNFQLGSIRYLQFKLTTNESCLLNYFDIKNTEA